MKLNTIVNVVQAKRSGHLINVEDEERYKVR
jgi:hypothetical protein